MQPVRPQWRCAVFACVNVRRPGARKPCCGADRGRHLRRALRDRARAQDRLHELLIATTGCLGVCAPHGHTVLLIAGGRRETYVLDDDIDALWARILAMLDTPDRGGSLAG